MAIIRNLMGIGMPGPLGRVLLGDLEDFVGATGTTQATAYEIGYGVTRFTGVDSGTGGVLPAGTIGDEILVINAGSNPLSIYPNSGSSINTLSANAAFSVATASSTMFKRVRNTLWMAADSSQDVFLQSGTGAVARTVQDKLMEIISSADNPTLGINNIALGSLTTTMRALTSGYSNTGVGYQVFQKTTSGYKNTAMGLAAMLENLDGYHNSGFGYAALQSNTSGYENTAVGYNALLFNTVGFQNTALGIAALERNVSGDNNVAVGNQALAYATTSYNTALGDSALLFLTTGAQNTAVGQAAMQGDDTPATDITGSNNTAIGYQSIFLIADGSNNCAMGYQSMLAMTGGDNNVAIGTLALQNLTTGDANTAVGYGAGSGITTGSNNTILGANVTGLAAGLAGNIILADGSGGIKMQWDGTYWNVQGSRFMSLSVAGYNTLYSGSAAWRLNNNANGAVLIQVSDAGAIQFATYTAATWVAGDKYLVVDASGNIHVSAVGPAS